MWRFIKTDSSGFHWTFTRGMSEDSRGIYSGSIKSHHSRERKLQLFLEFLSEVEVTSSLLLVEIESICRISHCLFSNVMIIHSRRMTKEKEWKLCGINIPARCSQTSTLQRLSKRRNLDKVKLIKLIFKMKWNANLLYLNDGKFPKQDAISVFEETS